MTEAEKKKLRAKAAKLSRPKPRELPSGMWRCEKMVDGVRISEVGPDPEELHAKVNAIAAGLIEKNKGVSSKTFEQAYNDYIGGTDNIFSPSTLLGYKRIKENHLKDICQMKMDCITQDVVQAKVNRLAKKRAPKTVENIYGLITAVYYSVYPHRKLQIKLPQEEKKEIEIPTEEEIKKITDACKGTKYELPILLAMHLGLRASEICGLKWSAYDGERIYIDRAVVAGIDGLAEKVTKSTSGKRVLYVPARIKELIDASPRSNEHIVQVSGQAMYKGFSRICEKNGIRHYRFHDLRHVFASVSISAGVPTEYIIKDLGHKGDRMLRAVYGHMMESQRKENSRLREQYYENLRTNFAQKTDDT